MGALNWNYNPEDFNEDSFGLMSVGEYRIRICDVVEKQSKNSGNDMLEIKFEVSGRNNKLWYYLVFNPDNVAQTNQNIGMICNSFNITPASPAAILQAKGKVGACRIKHGKNQHDEPRAEISYFINRKKQDSLEPWKEPPNSESSVSVEKAEPQFQEIQAGDLPF